MQEIDVAIQAAVQAVHLIRVNAGHADAQEKAPSDLVTSTDEAAQALIIRILEEAFPDTGVLAEEGAPSDLSDFEGWIVDPIDGTANFAHGLPPYAVSIGLRRESQMVMGLVLEVSSGDLFTAIRGKGAWRNGRRIQVSTRLRLADCIIATGFPFREQDYTEAYLEVLRRFLVETRGVRRFGVASVDLAYVACGLMDGFFETGLHPWDVAAGMLLVEEAGGRVTDYHGERDPLFAGQIVASNEWVHEEMLLLTPPLRSS